MNYFITMDFQVGDTDYGLYADNLTVQDGKLSKSYTIRHGGTGRPDQEDYNWCSEVGDLLIDRINRTKKLLRDIDWDAQEGQDYIVLAEHTKKFRYRNALGESTWIPVTATLMACKPETDED